MAKARRGQSLPSTEHVHPLALDLDLRSPSEIVRLLHREDRRAVRAVGKVLNPICKVAEHAARSLAAGGRLIYVGAGTSGRLGVLDAAECPPTFGATPRQVIALLAGGERAVTRAVEGAEDDASEGVSAIRSLKVSPKDTVVGISASAKTPYVLGALDEARRRSAKTALICASAPGRKPAVDVRIFVDTGPELVAGSTRLKAGTATKLVLNAISTAAFVSLGRIYRGRMVDLRPANQKLRDRAVRIVAEVCQLSPRVAAGLLERAGHRPALAIAMHLSGSSPEDAQRLLARYGLRELETRRRR